MTLSCGAIGCPSSLRYQTLTATAIMTPRPGPSSGRRARHRLACWSMTGSVGEPKKDPGIAGLIAVLGVISGVLLWILTIVLSHANLSRNGWSLSGNGALIVTYGYARV